MTAKPTAVVVRLPLSADQEETLFEISERDCLNSAIAAIGTPVAGSELRVVGYADGDEIDAFSPDESINPCAVIFAEEATVHNVSLVRQSDAQAALAAVQEENVRLRDHLETARSYLKEAPSVTARRGALDVIEEALKGPAA